MVILLVLYGLPVLELVGQLGLGILGDYLDTLLSIIERRESSCRVGVLVDM